MVLFATAPFQAIDTVPMATDSSRAHDREFVLLRDTCASRLALHHREKIESG